MMACLEVRVSTEAEDAAKEPMNKLAEEHRVLGVEGGEVGVDIFGRNLSVS